jgi:hypothetical protein
MSNHMNNPLAIINTAVTDEPDLKDEDAKEILHDVLTELY